MGLMSRVTGATISDEEHLQQSIVDILTTPVGSRVMNREYGSTLHDLIDLPVSRELVLRYYAATAEALRRWEPRLRVTNLSVDLGQIHDGVVELTLSGVYLIDGKAVTLRNVELKL